MGNCLESCFGSVRKNKTNYFTGRYKEYNVGIEFESLIEDDLAQQADSNMVTDRERDHLLNKRYSDLIKDQKRRDAEIEAELKRQEENVRLEEEAYNAAKRESARAARQTRALEQQRSKPTANGTAKSSWLGENESEWNVAGGEDDFEMFLESVKARSQTVRANAGLAAIPYPTTQSSNLDKQLPNSNSEGSVSVQDASSEQVESDSDWDPDFVGASLDGRSSPPDLNTSHVTEAFPVQSKSSLPSPVTNLTTIGDQMHEALKQERTEIIDEKKETNSHMTQPTNVQSVNVPTNTPDDKLLTSHAVNNISISKVSENRTEISTETSKPAAADDEDPFDFDKFLEELDLE